MNIEAVTPILNVSDFVASVEWFRCWGWEKAWEWGQPPSLGQVRCGKFGIMLCQGAQGASGRGANAVTFGAPGAETGDKGVWLRFGVDDVESIHRACLAAKLGVTFPPSDMPWGAREMPSTLGLAPKDPMPPACRAGARLHLSDSSSLEKPEAEGSFPSSEGNPGA